MVPVYVYAICKNEAAFVPRWFRSMSEADGIYVLDTGSTDGTPELLSRLGAQVEQTQISPWRFDTARNRSLDMVPREDCLCVCTDLDEVFHPGWREKMETAWTKGADQLRYRYTWSFRSDGKEDCVFYTEKAHSRQGWHWVNPVHEVLEWEGADPPRRLLAPGVQLDHHPDPAKSRGQYLPLLELAVSENPQNDRNLHYLGREYFFYRRWNECISALERHLTLSRWPEERCASMRYLAKAWENLSCPDRAEQWYLRAIAECPQTREPWLDYGIFAQSREDWHCVLYCALRALAISRRSLSYLSEGRAWAELPHDLACVGYFYTGDPARALEQGRLAAQANPDDQRLRNNMDIIQRFLREKAK